MKKDNRRWRFGRCSCLIIFYLTYYFCICTMNASSSFSIVNERRFTCCIIEVILNESYFFRNEHVQLFMTSFYSQYPTSWPDSHLFIYFSHSFASVSCWVESRIVCLVAAKLNQYNLQFYISFEAIHFIWDTKHHEKAQN